MLDERTYGANELISPILQKYQGPALLAYNNAMFTDKDFLSLSRLGDSVKIQDSLTTGKFGRGFNSVSTSSDQNAILLKLNFRSTTGPILLQLSQANAFSH